MAGGVVLGAAGGAAASAAPGQVSASTLVVSVPDPVAVELAATGSEGGDPATRAGTYLKREVTYLGGADLADRVARSFTRTAPPAIEATRVGDSHVLDITVTAADPETAVQQAQAAADTYVRARQQRLIDRIDAQVAAIDRRLQEIDVAVAALGQPDDEGPDPRQRQREMLSRQYAELLVARDELQRAAAEASQMARLVQQATLLSTGRLPAGAATALGFGALGALGGAAVMALTGLLTGRVRDERDVGDLGIPVLSPPLPPQRPSTHSLGALERAVHLQTLLLPQGPGAGGSLAVLGAGDDGDDAAISTAVQHARHAARHRPTLLACAGVRGVALDDLAAGSARGSRPRPSPGRRPADALLTAARPTCVPDLSVLTCGTQPVDLDDWVNALVLAAARAGMALVVVSPPLSRSSVGVTAARACRESVVVAEPDRTRVRDVDVTLRVLRASGVSVSGIVLGRSPLPSAVPAARARTGPDRTGPSGVAPAPFSSTPEGVGAPGPGRRDGRDPGTPSSIPARLTSPGPSRHRGGNRAPHTSTPVRAESGPAADRAPELRRGRPA